MRNSNNKPIQNFILNNLPIFLLVCTVIVFSLFSDKFLQLSNFKNILVQASSNIILATGITFVLITGGVDLSIGSIMFLSGAIISKLICQNHPPILSCALAFVACIICGLLNSIFISKFRILPFIVTLAAMYFWRGTGLWLTETRALNLPDNFTRLSSFNFLGVPLPIIMVFIIVSVCQWILSKTVFGKHLYATGENIDGAQKAGVNTSRIIFTVYLISSVCAFIGSVISLSQIGALSPTFGLNKEFSAIAAAVLGGTSLFGGKGKVFPGTLAGALLIQTIENGLVVCNADPYLYQIAIAAVILFAVLIDCTRQIIAKKQNIRLIRPQEIV